MNDDWDKNQLSATSLLGLAVLTVELLELKSELLHIRRGLHHRVLPTLSTAPALPAIRLW